VNSPPARLRPKQLKAQLAAAEARLRQAKTGIRECLILGSSKIFVACASVRW
jgi:hypothetical protein